MRRQRGWRMEDGGNFFTADDTDDSDKRSGFSDFPKYPCYPRNPRFPTSFPSQLKTASNVLLV